MRWKCCAASTASASPSSPRATSCATHWWRRSCGPTKRSSRRPKASPPAPPSHPSPDLPGETALTSRAAPAPVVHVGYAVPRVGVPASASFARWVAAALHGARWRKSTEVAIRIVNADEGRNLNRDYRGKDYATNVLSFPAELPPGVDPPLIGDPAICAPVVARQAGRQSKKPRHHWAHLTVHGTPHPLG